MTIRLLVMGAPRTKKNHGSVIVRKRAGKNFRYHIPSAAWTAWCSTARIFTVADTALLPFVGSRVPEVEYNCRAMFYRDARRGDAVGYYQGLADLLEKRGVLLDDECITQWDGSRLLIDRDNPRVELTLEEVA